MSPKIVGKRLSTQYVNESGFSYDSGYNQWLMVPRITCSIVDDGVPHTECTARDVLCALSEPRRRTVVGAVDAHEANWIDLDDLVADVRARTDELSAEGWRRELRHAHLPMLDDIGLVDYDTTGDAVRRYDCELVSDVLAVLENVSEGDTRERPDV